MSDNENEVTGAAKLDKAMEDMAQEFAFDYGVKRSVYISREMENKGHPHGVGVMACMHLLGAYISMAVTEETLVNDETFNGTVNQFLNALPSVIAAHRTCRMLSPPNLYPNGIGKEGPLDG